MRHCMLDLETMGLRPGCSILSIGAVSFGPGWIEEELGFKRNVSLQSCLNFGLTIDPSAEKWWSEQSPEARAALKDPEPVDLDLALYDFSIWYAEGKHSRVWSHGQSADIPWLEAAYDAVKVRIPGITVPWHYRDGRDTRTLLDLSPFDRVTARVEHCALQDAVAQAKDISTAMDFIQHHVPHISDAW